MDSDEFASMPSFGKDCKLALVTDSGVTFTVLPDLIIPVSGGFSFVPSGSELVRLLFF